MAKLGADAAAKARLVPERVDLSTPERQAHVIERVVAGVLTGQQNAKAAGVVVDAVRCATRIYENAEIERRLRALEAGR